jgi:hypothetical protein
VVLNLSPEAGEIDLTGRGRVLIGTDRSRDGETIAGRLGLSAFEGALVELGAGGSTDGLSEAF